jgi:hypothetical protein
MMAQEEDPMGDKTLFEHGSDAESRLTRDLRSMNPDRTFQISWES